MRWPCLLHAVSRYVGFASNPARRVTACHQSLLSHLLYELQTISTTVSASLAGPQGMRHLLSSCMG